MIPLFALVLVASIGQASDQELQCPPPLRDEEQKVTRAVQGGYVVTVRRKADPALTKDACVVEVRGPSGQVVFTREGYNTRLHADNGRDVDNDGTPDLVIGHDTRGDTRCCWEYTILSLRPVPHVAGTFSNPSFEVDVNRRTVVWSLLPFEDLGPDLAPAPTIAVAQQYRDGRFVEITSEYCAVILAGTAKGWANLSEDLWQLEGSRRAASRADTARPPSFEVETTRLSATTVALQMMYCGLDGDARELIRQVWPDDQHEKIRASIEAAVASARRRY